MLVDVLEPVPELPLRVQAAIDIDPGSNLLLVCDPDTVSHAATTNMTRCYRLQEKCIGMNTAIRL